HPGAGFVHRPPAGPVAASPPAKLSDRRHSAPEHPLVPGKPLLMPGYSAEPPDCPLPARQRTAALELGLPLPARQEPPAPGSDIALAPGPARQPRWSLQAQPETGIHYVLLPKNRCG